MRTKEIPVGNYLWSGIKKEGGKIANKNKLTQLSFKFPVKQDQVIVLKIEIWNVV